MCLMSFSLALVVLGFRLDSSYGVLLAVQKYTNIDYVSEVNASLQFNFSESGFIQGTAQLPCQPPTKCVEFYPGKKSFLIKGGTQENYSAVILTPEDSQLAHIAIVVVNKNEFFPELPGANCIKPFISDPFYSPPISVVLDKSIGDVRLLGNISRYEPGSVNKSLQIILPYVLKFASGLAEQKYQTDSNFTMQTDCDASSVQDFPATTL
nr:unnamed protein product [Spirometra erinaceieuropaei]